MSGETVCDASDRINVVPLTPGDLTANMIRRFDIDPATES